MLQLLKRIILALQNRVDSAGIGYWKKFYVVRTVHFGMKLYNDHLQRKVYNFL
jgi:hypothetical protein